MAYRHPRQAYLFETVVALLSLLLCLKVGKLGYLALALIALRPVLLETIKTKQDQTNYWIYYHAMRLAVYFAGGAILLTVFAFQFEPFSSYDKKLIFTLIVPWFMLAHGFIGYFVAGMKEVV